MPSKATDHCHQLQPQQQQQQTHQQQQHQQQQAAANMLAVEELVHEIKENLRLKAPTSIATANSLRSLRRPSPYHIPCRSWAGSDAPNTATSTTPSSGLLVDGGGGGGGPSTQQPATSSISGISHNNNSSSSSSMHHHHHHLSCCKQHHHHHHLHPRHRGTGASTDDIDDPYELLQALISNNNLVKEAVRRLQLNLSPKQRYFYESDEDSSRSPLLRMCHLELWN